MELTVRKINAIEEIGGTFLLVLITDREDFFCFVEILRIYKEKKRCISKKAKLLSEEIWTEFICK
ncbi:hypothetical protein CRYUN_Cryun02cG0043400 [Craigia yunnanensis]